MLKDKADNTYRELDYSRYHKNESNNNLCVIIHCTEENSNRTELLGTLTLLLEIMYYVHKLQISHLSTSR